MAEAVAAGLFAIWLAATIAAAFEGSRAARVVHRVDALGLVPIWTFFAPNPGTFDYHLLSRTRARDGSTTPFGEVAPPVGMLRRSLWHPQKRVRKAIYDCCHELLAMRGVEREGAEYSLAYLTLLSIVVADATRPDAEAVQFALVRSGVQLAEPELLARSRFHPLGR